MAEFAWDSKAPSPHRRCKLRRDVPAMAPARHDRPGKPETRLTHSRCKVGWRRRPMTHDPSSSLITGPPRHRLRGGCAATYLRRGRVRAARYGRITVGKLGGGAAPQRDPGPVARGRDCAFRRHPRRRRLPGDPTEKGRAQDRRGPRIPVHGKTDRVPIETSTADNVGWS
jgi:hypothetical protein